MVGGHVVISRKASYARTYWALTHSAIPCGILIEGLADLAGLAQHSWPKLEQLAADRLINVVLGKRPRKGKAKPSNVIPITTRLKA